jgi:hypothetical protein
MKQMKGTGAGAASQAGQAAFAAIAEVVKVLEADPNTDWSKVDLEGLRQHLIDMDDVILRSRVRADAVAGGATFVITGEGRVAEAIGRMVLEHARMLDGLPDFRAVAQAAPGGAQLTVTAERSGDGAAAVRIRGLGFAGLMVTGAHHTEHHLMIARGAGGGHVHK